MTIKFTADKCRFWINGKEQFCIEELRLDEKVKREKFQFIDSPYPKYRYIVDDGSGELTFALNDLDDDYGPVELLGFITGYNDYSTSTNTWTITKMDLTTDPSDAANLLRYIVARQALDSGSGITLTEGSTDTTYLAYPTRGEELDKVCLNIISETVDADEYISVTSEASSEVGYIHDSDLNGASGETWCTLRDIGDTANVAITTNGGTHDPMATDALKLTLENGGGGETVVLDNYQKTTTHATYIYDYGGGTDTITAISAGGDLMVAAGSEEIGDATIIGDIEQFNQFTVDIATAATWSNDGAKYQYPTAQDTWTDLTIIYDSSDSTAGDGLRPFQVDGIVTFQPPNDWWKGIHTANTGSTAPLYCIRSVLTATTLTQTATCQATTLGLIPSNLWYQLRMYNANHLDINVREYMGKDSTDYIEHVIDRVWIQGSTLKMEPHKAPRATLKFLFEEYTPGT